MVNTAFSLHRVTFAHATGSAEAAAATVLQQLDLNIPAASVSVLRGPSGCGKSTLLKLLARLLEPNAGDIRFFDTPMGEIPPPQLRADAVYVHQEPVVEPGSVAENLLLPFELGVHADRTPPGESELRRGLEEVGLGDIAPSQDAAGLSGGQRLRLCLLRALLISPRVLLLDEPFAALDAASARLVQKALERRVLELGLTVVLASHDATLQPWQCLHNDVALPACTL